MNTSLLRKDFRLEPASCYVDARCPRYKVVVPAERDLSPLLPYLNAVAKVLYYDPEEPALVFRLEGWKVAVRKDNVQIGPVPDMEIGRRAKEKVEAFLEKVWSERDSLTPRYEPHTLPPPLEIYKLLPRTNCGRCGELTCMAFAVKLASLEAELSDCAPLYEDPRFKEAAQKLEALLS
ncbi:hypothetical protein FVE67_06955 [Thermosulfurimonas marina]|uniref:4Fe-4S domain-containing protein n=1 Tax=Thermosulfurimonas marina TaxID=2047767 RepID=A0A6H1WTS5_9BACT|nr:(Fe-S)-binding protein [Thermosulfurimonas marina]QJA06549.1 hypothetical protein FVE67_06955 [Thermosulfurimonas marina]